MLNYKQTIFGIPAKVGATRRGLTRSLTQKREMGTLTAAPVLPSKLKQSSLFEQQSSLFLYRRSRPKQKNLTIVPVTISLCLSFFGFFEFGFLAPKNERVCTLEHLFW